MDMFRFVFFAVGERRCHSFTKRNQRGFDLQILELRKYHVLRTGGYFGPCYGWKAMPGPFVVAMMR